MTETSSPAALSLDYALAMQAGLNHAAGLTEQELDTQREPAANAVRALRERAQSGALGFLALPSDRGIVEQARALQAALPDFTDVLVLGIGGSSLGARALLQALGPALPAPEAKVVHLPDNSDPWLLAALLERLDPARTIVLVVSKSGGTVETAAQLLIVHAWLLAALGTGRTRTRMIAITDPKSGSLRALASERKWATLPIPSNVGGRFSVLTAVGVLPAVLTGLDAEALMLGAARMTERCMKPELYENPAALIATLSYLHDKRGGSIHVMMPYADRLRAFTAWYVQLWAESLGKRKDRAGKIVEVGPTPLGAVGATDQHAQAQLFMEGPRNKLVTFIGVRSIESDLRMPSEPGDASYLGGHSLGELLSAERLGTTEALAADGRPSLTLELPRIDAHSMGELFMLYQIATALSGELYGIDAFDQPGVELGKQLAFGLLGRKGFEDAAKRIEAARSRRPDRYRA